MVRHFIQLQTSNLITFLNFYIFGRRAPLYGMANLALNHCLIVEDRKPVIRALRKMAIAKFDSAIAGHYYNYLMLISVQRKLIFGVFLLPATQYWSTTGIVSV